MVKGLTSNVSYQYDSANRLTSAGGQAYTFDANGNLLNDGQNTYAYDSANRLTSVNGTSSYTYSGLGDRLSQTVDGQVTNYTLDLNTGLTQVLSDGTNVYTYGLRRISQTNNATVEYFLGDALGSVRQLTDTAGELTYAKSYDPYGVVTQTSGESQSAYGFTGEQQSNDMVYLRARYYSPLEGRFLTKDPSGAESNLYLYGKANPINRIDPSGLYSGAMIEKNINLSEFFSHGFMDETNHDRFGFYALLRKAQDFDYIQVGSLNLQSIYPDVSFSSGEAIWSINCETIMVGGQTLNQYFHNVVKDQKHPSIWWRDTSAMFYDLFSISTYPNSRRSFADGIKNGNIAESDVPQFRALSLGLGKYGELQLIVDINGAFHLAYSNGLGRMWGLGYLEGYVCTWKWSGCFGNTPSPAEATAAIDGFCQSNDLVLIGGVNVTPICTGLHPLTEGNWTAISTFSIGAQAGAGPGFGLTLPLSIGIAPKPAMGWKWALDDYINGVTYEDILAYRTQP